MIEHFHSNLKFIKGFYIVVGVLAEAATRGVL